MYYLDIIQHNFKTQKLLNDFIKPDWSRTLTIKDYYIATKQEISELIDCYPWKWWKHMTPDYNNAKIELVDIWHFLMSMMLLDSNLKYNNLYTHTINDAFYDIEEIDKDNYLKHIMNLEEINENDIIDLALTFDNMLYQSIENNLYLQTVIPSIFARLVYFIFNGNYKEFFKLYYLKAMLNIHRQYGGYKEGTYQKIIDNIEDNQQLFELTKKIDLEKVMQYDDIIQLYNNLFAK